MKRILIGMTVVLASWLLPLIAMAQQMLVAKPLVAKKVAELPAGPLYWRIENFRTVAQAQAAAGPTGLVAESGGKIWLFTLGPAGRSTADGTKVAEVGPLPPVVATQYLLRITETTGAPGSMTRVHTHPGVEAFHVLAGEQSQRTLRGVTRLGTGQSAVGSGANTIVQNSSSGSTDLHMLVMHVVDATKPFSSPATFP
jgi:quercetin dioxygenase-like cupin family protein